MSIQKKINVAVIGATGYTGLDLVYLLSKHPKIRILNLCATKNLGKDIFEYSQVDELYSDLKYKCDRIQSKYGIDVQDLLEKGEIYTFIDYLK